jgi:glycosyltransferase involved in cell wall biosynthesis
MVSCLLKRKQVVFIQDASSFVNKTFFTFAFRTWYQVAITVVGKMARHIVTISEHAKSELVRYAHIPERKLTVTYLSAKHFLEVNTSAEGEQAFLKKHTLHHPYILGVSSLSPNKNFKSIIAAYKLVNKEKFPGLCLVIAGGTNPKVFQGGLAFDDTVKHLGYVSDEELVYLYRNAQVFAYPSFYEGFGIPPLEAMLYDCPVIVSNTSSMPEVCSDAAYYCNPYSVPDIAEKMEQVLSLTEAQRAALINRGKKRTEEFDWNKCAVETVEVIKSTY